MRVSAICENLAASLLWAVAATVVAVITQLPLHLVALSFLVVYAAASLGLAGTVWTANGIAWAISWVRARRQNAGTIVGGSPDSTQSPSFSISPGVDDARDALSHLVVGGEPIPNLRVDKTDNGWPITFPILIRNTRPISVELSSFDVEVWGDGRRWYGITWPIGGRGLLCSNNGKLIVEDRNGASIPIYDGKVEVPGDDYRVIRVPIYIAQVQPKPVSTPVITMRGMLRLSSDGKTQDVEAPDRKLALSLDAGDWSDVVTHVLQ